MKKSLIALAVAGAFAAPAFAATSNVDVYGVLNIAVEDTNATNVTPAVLDNTSRLGFKGSEDLGGGLKAIWQIESALGGNGATIGNNACTSKAPALTRGAGADGILGNLDDVWTAAAPSTSCTTAGLATRNTFVGLAGGFGTVLMGRHDTPYKLGTASLDIFGDTVADYNLGRLNGVQLLFNSHDARVGNALAYISPTWSGFHFAAAVVAANEATATNNDTIDATSFTGVYVNGPLFASLSYQDVKDAVALGSDSSAWKLGLGYSFGDAKVGFIYEKVDADTTLSDRKSWQLNGSYTMGPIVLKAEYGKVSDADFGITANADQTLWALGVDYNLSKRTTAYLVYGKGDSDAAVAAVSLNGAAIAASANGDVSGWNIGIKHSF